jgi:hypothetical protein
LFFSNFEAKIISVTHASDSSSNNTLSCFFLVMNIETTLHIITQTAEYKSNIAASEEVLWKLDTEYSIAF